MKRAFFFFHRWSRVFFFSLRVSFLSREKQQQPKEKKKLPCCCDLSPFAFDQKRVVNVFALSPIFFFLSVFLKEREIL